MMNYNNWRCRKMYTKNNNSTTNNNNNALFSSMFCCFIWNAHASSSLNMHVHVTQYLYVSTSIQLKLPLIRLIFSWFFLDNIPSVVSVLPGVLIATAHKNDSMSSSNNVFRFVVDTNRLWCHTKKNIKQK